jgi:hypothetical protein
MPPKKAVTATATTDAPTPQKKPRAKKAEPAPRKTRKKKTTETEVDVTASSMNDNIHYILQLNVENDKSADKDSFFENKFYSYKPDIACPVAFEYNGDLTGEPFSSDGQVPVPSVPSDSLEQMYESKILSVCGDGDERTKHHSLNVFGVDASVEDVSKIPILSNHNAKRQRTFVHLEEFISRDEWPIKVDAWCFWCCHPFSNIPFGLPTKYNNKIFHVYGSFCSLECTASYNFYNTEYRHDMWETYQLINLLSRRIGYSDQSIKLAPMRFVLKAFGGYMDITEFRAFSNTQKSIQSYPYPMVAMTQNMEEINDYDSTRLIHRSLPLQNIDKQRLYMLENRIRLDRKKKGCGETGGTTLDESMKLSVNSA